MTTSESKGRFFLLNESIRIDSHNWNAPQWNALAETAVFRQTQKYLLGVNISVFNRYLSILCLWYLCFDYLMKIISCLK